LGGAVPVRVGPAPPVGVPTAYDLRCWTLPVVLPRGFDGAVMPVHLCLLGLRQQCPFVPLHLDPQEVQPFSPVHNPGFGCTALQTSPLSKAATVGSTCCASPSREGAMATMA